MEPLAFNSPAMILHISSPATIVGIVPVANGFANVHPSEVKLLLDELLKRLLL